MGHVHFNLKLRGRGGWPAIIAGYLDSERLAIRFDRRLGTRSYQFLAEGVPIEMCPDEVRMGDTPVWLLTEAEKLVGVEIRDGDNFFEAWAIRDARTSAGG